MRQIGGNNFGGNGDQQPAPLVNVGSGFSIIAGTNGSITEIKTLAAGNNIVLVDDPAEKQVEIHLDSSIITRIEALEASGSTVVADSTALADLSIRLASIENKPVVAPVVSPPPRDLALLELASDAKSVAENAVLRTLRLDAQHKSIEADMSIVRGALAGVADRSSVLLAEISIANENAAKEVAKLEQKFKRLVIICAIQSAAAAIYMLVRAL